MASPRFPQQPDLFAEPPPAAAARRRLYSIAPHAPFLPTLVDRILDGTLLGDWPRTGPFWLSDVTIVLPTRRARLALAEEFLKRIGKEGCLLPDIRTFAGEHQDEEPFLPPHDAPELPPAIGTTERRLTLARLIDAWARTPEGAEVLATPPNPAEILSLADSLAELIDDLAIEDVPFARLRALPPEDLADSWQQILKFLKLAFEAWPAILSDRGKADASVLRNLRLRRQAGVAPLIFGERPVIAAGSTGSIPATAALLRAIADLPRGALVLPGLDTSLTPVQHDALLKDGENTHGHPQYGLGKLLRSLGAGPAEVIELATGNGARTSIVREALTLADATSHWAESRARLAPQVADAAAGLTTIAARTADEEARAIAICARDAVARGETVGILSPDQTLSRRIAAELKRFGIDVDDPAGTPLFQSPAGRLARVVLALHESDYGPVELIALLRNKATTLGLDRAELRRLTDRMELRLLRGQRMKPGVAGLRDALAANAALPDEINEKKNPAKLAAEEREAIAALIDRMEAALAPLAAAPSNAALLAQAVLASVTSIVAPGETIAGMAELEAWAADLAAHPGQGPALTGGALDTVLFALMRGHVVRPTERRRDDIHIWGLLEARLQSRDLIVLAGLNEEIWPQVADSGPWLSRGMRLALGLEPPERRQGQAAHDFEMAVGNARAVLAFAERLGTSPALPSRLVQRLEAFLGPDVSREVRARGRRWIDQAKAVDATTNLTRAGRPMPRPPAETRAKKLSVTEVENLFRSPYDIYARHTLKLRKLAPLGEPPDARDRGSIVHEIFAHFVTDHDVNAPDALDQLQTLAKAAFSGLDVIAERRDIWLHRFTVAARQFLDFERARQARVRARHAEVDGSWTFPTGFTLTGRADRIDVLLDGTAEILDFKTGGIPDPGDMTAYLAPQLPLEAAMLKAGALKDIAPATVSALTYIKVGLGPEAFRLFPYRAPEGDDLARVAEEMARRLQGHVDMLLLRDDLPMTSRVLPRAENPQRRFIGDYDHLARVDEWAVNEGDDSE